MWPINAGAVILTVGAPPVLSISASVGVIVLEFPNFLPGTDSNSEQVVYTVQSNTMAAGTINGAISAALSDDFEHVDFKGDVDSYSNLGDPSFASLAESSGGFVTIATTTTDLADKTPGTGQGDICIDGTLTITWKGTLNSVMPAGTDAQILTLTIVDGQ